MVVNILSKEKLTFIVSEELAGERLDRFLVMSVEDMSRSYIQKLIRQEKVTVDAKKTKPGLRIESGSVIEISIPEPVSTELMPENIVLDILYQDSDIVVINKQQGLVVHPGSGNYEGTLVNALLYHIHDLSGIGGVERPGIVHRLDRDTSGVMVVAKNDSAHLHLSEQFAQRTVEKHYTAIVSGEVRDSAVIEKPIARHKLYRHKMCVDDNGRYAKTAYTLVRRWSQAAELDVRIYTGRTHQIRVHLASNGMPVIGDELYSKRKNYSQYPLMLHSRLLVITHPDGRQMRFEAPLPVHMRTFIAELESEL